MRLAIKLVFFITKFDTLLIIEGEYAIKILTGN